MTERRKNQSEEWTYFTLLFIYFITVNKYRFCISVIGYINVQIICIGSKKSISVDHKFFPSTCPSTGVRLLCLICVIKVKSSCMYFYSALNNIDCQSSFTELYTIQFKMCSHLSVSTVKSTLPLKPQTLVILNK